MARGVISIGSHAFDNCSSLTAVHISSIEAWCYIDFEDSNANPLYYAKNLYINGELVTELVIPNSVTAVKDYAFRSCTSLTTITLPKSLTSIGNSAFSGCSSLTAITIPEGVTSIGDDAFYGCSSLTAISIPEGVTSIGSYAFYNCSSLTSITIPEGVTRIGNYAFDGCSSLKSIIIEDGSTTLSMGYNGLGYYNWEDHAVAGQGLFYDCPLEEVYLGRDLSYGSDYSFGYSPFYNQTQLKYLTIGDNVTSIGKYAFSGCSSLTVISIPEGVTSIGSHAFYNCSSLTAISIPEGVTSIGDDAFSGCSSLTSITIPEGVTSIGSSAFYNCSSLTVISIPENSQLTSIGSSAFSGCNSLTSITIPEGVTSIGSYAFYNCSSLTAVHISSIEAWCYIDFEDSNANPLYYAKNLYINGELVTELVIPNSVTAVKDNAFSGCTSLTTITIPENSQLTSIGSYAFYGCENLKMVINYSDLTLQKGDSGNGYVAYYADKVVNVDCIVDGYCFKTRDGVHCLIDYLGDDTALVLPEDCQGDDYVIAESVFQGNEEIVSVKIPQTVGTIGYGAFADCANLASVEMARGVMSIGDKAFENCTSLASVTIPQNMRSIGHGAFNGCSSLASVEFKEGVETFGDNAFEGCAALTEITLPKSLTAVGANAFKGCSGFTSVIVDKNVETFGAGAFEGCTVVKTLVVKGSVMPTVPSSALTLIVLYSPHPLAAEEFANKVYRDATLYVPTGSIARYQAADVWKNFWTIKEFDSTQEMSLSLDQTAATLTEDESITLTASITPEFMADMTVTWSTSDDAVATVDEHGVVTALAAGTATITATAGDYSATCVVTVESNVVDGIDNSEIINHKSEIIYDLSGRRVTHPAKGIYIVGGKKVVIK